MIKRIWTFKRIILAIIIFMCTIIVTISLQKSIMGTDKLQRDFGVALLFIVVLVCLLYFFIQSFNRFLIISLDVLICRYSPSFRAFPALFISEEPHKSFYYPSCFRSQK